MSRRGVAKQQSSHRSALLIIDMFNHLDFPGGRKLLRHAIPVASYISNLKKRAKRSGVPIIYVNDNYHRWSEDLQKLYGRSQKTKGRELAKRLPPEEGDFFVMKPKHSGFHATSLEILLKQLQVKRLVITGIATDICVLFTVYDAYIRDFEVTVPVRATAAVSLQRKNQVLKYMREIFHIKTPRQVHLGGI